MQQLEPGKKTGLIVVLTGSGKGKTTSALGMTLRAVGHKLRVCIIQFMKSDLHSGEITGLRWLAPLVEFHQAGKGFCPIQGNTIPFHELRANAQCSIELAEEKIKSGMFEIVILDEINNALKLGLVDLPQVLQLLDTKPPELHLILSGRDANPKICARADTVTRMMEVKHASRKGIEAQQGIDY